MDEIRAENKKIFPDLRMNLKHDHIEMKTLVTLQWIASDITVCLPYLFPRIEGFIAKAVVIAEVAGRFGVVTTMITRYAVITIIPAKIPLINACLALADRGFVILTSRLCHLGDFGILVIYPDTLTVKKKV